jgi:glycosyltransferase involved in cell wall biosynthesis
VAISRFERQIFEGTSHLNPSRFKVIIQNGGNLNTSQPLPNSIPGRLVSNGRLERYKGHYRVIKAPSIVRATIPNATLHIFGSGPYADELQALAEALVQALVFAALSEYEAHPVAVIEALTLGVATVGLCSAGIGDLVQDGG